MLENFWHPEVHVQKLQISLLMLITDFCPSPLHSRLQMKPSGSGDENAPRHDQYLTHAHNHITPAVTAMDNSMFRLYSLCIAPLQRGIAVWSMSGGNWPYRRVGTCASVHNLVLQRKWLEWMKERRKKGKREERGKGNEWQINEWMNERRKKWRKE